MRTAQFDANWQREHAHSGCCDRPIPRPEPRRQGTAGTRSEAAGQAGHHAGAVRAT